MHAGARKSDAARKGEEPGISASLIQALGLSVERLGGDRSHFLDRVGLSFGSGSDQRVSGSRVDATLDELRGRLGPVPLGLHLALTTPVGALGFIDYHLLSSANLGVVLESGAELFRIHTNRVTIVVEGRRECVSVALVWAGGSRDPLWPEFIFAWFVSRCSAALGRPVRVREVSLAHKSPSGRLHESLFRAPARFRSSVDSISIERDELECPFVTKDELTHQALEARLRESEQVERASFASRARSALSATLSRDQGRVDLLARSLGVTPRTLQRRLHAEGTSHRELLDGVRRQLALAAVAQPEFVPGRVQELLGFESQRALYRSFKAWTGRSPQQYRHTLVRSSGGRA